MAGRRRASSLQRAPAARGTVAETLLALVAALLSPTATAKDFKPGE
jgi:hypothetical protein